MSTLVARRARSITVVAAIAMSSVAACVTSPDALAAQLQPDACKLLTRKDATRVLGKAARREARLQSVQGSECIYAAEKDAKRVVRLALAQFGSDAEASDAYTRARAKAELDGLKIENVRRLGQRAHWLPQTNNFERSIAGEQITFGELTVLQGRRIYSVDIAPPSMKKAREAINLVIAD